MKVIHILKRMETIDEDVKELRKVEKSLAQNKSYSTPIYMSIEKQINILLGEKIKLLELKIENPPAELVNAIEGSEPVKISKPVAKLSPKKIKPQKQKSGSRGKDDSGIGILTQDMIDEQFTRLKKETKPDIGFENEREITDEEDINDDSVKLLDVALEKGTLNKDEIGKEKKKVRFFKDNFPGESY